MIGLFFCYTAANMRMENWGLAAGMALFGAVAGYYKGMSVIDIVWSSHHSFFLQIILIRLVVQALQPTGRSLLVCLVQFSLARQDFSSVCTTLPVSMKNGCAQ